VYQFYVTMVVPAGANALFVGRKDASFGDGFNDRFNEELGGGR